MSRELKIVCAGSSGGGKTTLADLLHATWVVSSVKPMSLTTYSRPGAAAKAMGYEKPSLVPLEDIDTFQWYALFEQLHAERMGGSGFYDRGSLDFLAYARYQGSHVADAYVNMVRRMARDYALIIVVPPNSRGTEDNGVRHLHGVQEVHEQLLHEIARLGLQERTMTLKMDTPGERVDEVFAEIVKRGLLVGHVGGP